MPFFVELETGEVSQADSIADEFAHLFQEVPEWEVLSAPEFMAPDVELEDRSWVIDWYLRRKAEIEARMVARKESFAAGCREDLSALRCLDWRYLEEVEELTRVRLAAQAGKKKSVTTTFGKVGWRKNTKTVIVKGREEEVICWLLERDEEHPAVKLTPSILKKQLPVGEEIPGVIWPSGDVFFANPAKAK